MTWSEIDKDGKNRYIKGRGGDFFYLSKDKSRALDDVPSGWEVRRKKNGRLILRRA